MIDTLSIRLNDTADMLDDSSITQASEMSSVIAEMRDVMMGIIEIQRRIIDHLNIGQVPIE